MALVCRWKLLLLVFLSFSSGVSAETAENRAFNAAAEAFRGGFYQRAGQDLQAFISKNPNSAKVPEAYLLTAQALLQLSNHVGALDILSSHIASSGPLRDQYLFWMSEACFRQGNLNDAAGHLKTLREEHSGSPRRLEAAIREGNIRSRLGQWPAIVELLGGTNGVLAVSAITNSLAQHGQLLLASAYLAQGHYGPAEAALGTLASVTLEPSLDWQRHSLLVRLRSASDKLEEALSASTNLLQLATNAPNPRWRPESIAVNAGLLERAGNRDDAFKRWQQNLVQGVPAEFQRQAMTRIAELAMARGKPPEAIDALEGFLAQEPQSPVLDTALLLLGDLRLRDYVSAPAGKGPALERAIVVLKNFAEAFPTNALFGKAQLNLGWCLWLKSTGISANDDQNKNQRELLLASLSAFESASQRLPVSTDQAVALFKLADVQSQIGSNASAISSLRLLVDRYKEAPEVRTNFIEQALYQTVRAAIPAGDRDSATNAIARLIEWYPRGPLAERAVLLDGIEVSRYDTASAMKNLQGFLQAFPDAQLRPEVELAIARCYEQQNEWTNAITRYDDWLSSHTNHPAMDRAEYSRAWASYRAGLETNAFGLFTNYVSRFPDSEFRPLAEWWIADNYFRSGQLENAELAYKRIYQNTKWTATNFVYSARMMAGRAAFARQGGAQAIEYFTGLWNDTNCPMDLRAQALFAYGDTLMTMDTAETNRVANYDEAIRVFSRIIELFPTNSLAALAWGQKASCLLQWAQLSQQYDAASNGFYQVLASEGADGRARSIAKVGLASVLELQSKQNPLTAISVLEEALNHCLDVLFGSEKVLRANEMADPFWTSKAGIEAARLAEALGKWDQAIEIYEKLKTTVPVLRPRMEKSILRAKDQREQLRVQQQVGRLPNTVADKK